jgi:hypothetical protein
VQGAAIEKIDLTLESVNKWIVKGGQALASFYLEGQGLFVRDTLARNGVEVPSRTSTNRAFHALIDYVRFLRENGLERTGDEQQVLAILREICCHYLGALESDSEGVRNSADNSINMFTDGQLLLSVALASTLREVLDLRFEPSSIDTIQRIALEIAAEREKQLLLWNGGKIDPDDEVHDFVTLHLVRGIDTLRGNVGDPNMSRGVAERVERDVLRQLGFSFAGVSSRYDPAELAFSVALLARYEVPNAQQLIESAIRSTVESQGSNGTWPAARMVSYGTRGLLHVTSYEVALTLANLLMRDLLVDDGRLAPQILGALDKSFEFVCTTFAYAGSRKGWANDHARWTGHVESWVTAIVLMFLLRYRDVLTELRQKEVLKHYRSVTENYEGSLPVWPDLLPLVRIQTELSWKALENISDPTDQGELSDSLRRKILNPINSDWTRRPYSISLVLAGPPGSRKTSLVRSIARVLQWPLIILSPPQFLSAGLEGFEATSEKIFQDLLRLRRVIVLFDECEDFFRLRTAEQRVESRTVGAFITSGMLPRLQSLRDKRWVIFVLATNSQIGELDKAVVRQGRFDFAYYLSYPGLFAQKRYIESRLGKSDLSKQFNRALDQFSQAHPKNKPAPVISFSLLDLLIKKIDHANSSTEEDQILSKISEIVGQDEPEDLLART